MQGNKPRVPGVYFVEPPVRYSIKARLSHAPDGEPRPGQCALCGARHEKVEMARHVATCAVDSEISEADKSGSVLLEAYAIHDPEYWLFVQVDAAATLNLLDQFIRQTWLSCCNHRSELRVNGFHFASDVEPGLGGRIAPQPLHEGTLTEIAERGIPLDYVYVAEPATTLMLRVVRWLPRMASNVDVRLVARNTPPQVLCACGTQAVKVCRKCRLSAVGWLCERCVPGHTCADGDLLPVVNSPRCGQCTHPGSNGATQEA